MLELTRDYNELTPPENPDYPWVPKDWQPLCYYCAQPIRLTKPVAYHRQRCWASWEHSNPATSGNQYVKGSHWHCDPQFIRPTNEIDDPRCHICGTQTTAHAGVCSACGKPPFHATTMSAKEEEITRRFGWTRESSEAKAERQRVTVTEAIGALTVTAAVLGVLAWMTGSLPTRPTSPR
jgi:hypothetical protein